MIKRLTLAIVHEPVDYKRALLLAQAALEDGRREEAERLVGIVYELMDAREWPATGGDQNGASDLDLYDNTRTVCSR